MPAAPVVVPRELTARESHPIVAKAKATLARKFKPTRSAAIDGGVTICWYLVALDRGDEARALARQLGAAVTFDGNHALWSPAADALCLAARLARGARAANEARALVQRLVDNPAFAVMPERDLREWVGRAAADLADAREETSATWARNGALASLQRACYFRETAGHGFYYDAWIETAALDAVIAGGLDLLRTHLAVKGPKAKPKPTSKAKPKPSSKPRSQ